MPNLKKLMKNIYIITLSQSPALEELDAIIAIKYFTFLITFQSSESLQQNLLTDAAPGVVVALLEELHHRHDGPQLAGLTHPLVDLLTKLLGTPPVHQPSPLALVAPLKVALSGKLLQHLLDALHGESPADGGVVEEREVRSRGQVQAGDGVDLGRVMFSLQTQNICSTLL